MKKSTKTILGISSILLVLSLLLWLLYNNHEDIERIKNIRLSFVILIIFLTLIEFYINGYMIKILLEPFNIKVKIKEFLGLSLITTFGNYIAFFRAGTSAKAVYLKKYHNLPFSSFIAASGAGYVVTLLVYGLLGIIFSLWMLVSQNFNIILFYLFLIIFLGSILSILYFPKMPSANNFILKQVYNILDGWHKLRKNHHFILHFSTISLLLYVISTFKLYLLYHSLSYDISITAALFLSLLANLSVLFSITPAGLGIREAMLAFTSQLLEIGIKSGIYVSAVERGITIILVSILTPIFTYVLYKKTTQTS